MKTKIVVTLAIAMICFTSIRAQHIVKTGKDKKHLIFEEFTGIDCPSCATANGYLNAIKYNLGDVIHPIRYFASFTHRYHSVPYAEIFDRDYPNHFQDSDYQGQVGGRPVGFFNREPDSTGGLGSLYNAWIWFTNYARSIDGPLNVAVKSDYDPNLQKINVKVEVYNVDDVPPSHDLMVFITEDSLLSDYQDGTNASPSNPYVHDYVFREHLNSGDWGDPIIGHYKAGDFYTREYEFYMSNAIDPINISKARVVAFVLESETRLHTILNGISVPADGGEASTGVGQVFLDRKDLISNSNLKVYPNPSKDLMYVELPDIKMEQIIIRDILGRVTYKSSKIGSHSFQLQSSMFSAPGVYTMEVQTPEGVIYHKLQRE